MDKEKDFMNHTDDGAEQQPACSPITEQTDGSINPSTVSDVQEVVEYYPPLPQPQEVVMTYLQPRRIPGRTAQAAPAPSQTIPALQVPSPAAVPPVKTRHSRRGLWIFLGCLLVLSALAAVAYLSNETNRSEPVEAEETADYTAEVSIASYPFGEGAKIELSSTHGKELTIQEIYRLVNPAVVTVIAQLDIGASVGTGVIFRDDGYLFTNYHVVAGGTDCSVTLASGKTYDAKYVGGDISRDIAVLKVNAKDLPAAEMGNSDALAVGDPVYAIGNPLGVELRGTLTDGIVSAINRDVKVEGRTMTLIQTNAALNEGNSGGPLINVYGQVIGINTIKMMSFTSNVEGLGFALPMASVEKMVNDILDYGEVQPEPQLGILVGTQLRVLQDGTEGAEVLEVEANSAADQAGLQMGDVIISAGGENVSATHTLLRIRQQFRVGDEMPMRIWRNGKYLDVTLHLDQAAK